MHRYKILFPVIIIIFFWSCTKIDTTSIGSGLIPAVDNVNTFDTLITVIANNNDSFPTDCALLGPTDDRPLGYIGNDPYFGQTAANIYTELKPASFPHYWPASPSKLVLDSVVLVLSYKGTYGDTTANQKIEVYEVEPGFKADTSSCSFHDYFPPLLGSKTFKPLNLDDSAISFKEKAINQLRIKLNNSFGQLFLSQDSITGKLINSTTFKTLFRGFAIVPAVPSIGNSISFFNIADTNTKLAFYYHYPKTGSAGDTSVVSNFRLVDSSMSATYVRRTRTGAEINLHLAQPAGGDDPIYIQTTPGTFATIKIPDLPTISNRIIHRAELIVDQVYSASPLDGYFTTPNFLYLDLKDTTYTNWYQPIPCDFNNSSGTPDLVTFGGFRRIVKDPFGNLISRYTFNLSRYVQNILTKRKKIGTLRLRAPADIDIPRAIIDSVCNQLMQQTFYPINQPVSGRVKLGGGTNANYKMRLRLVYSRL